MLSRITCRAVIAAAFALALGGIAQANRASQPAAASLRNAMVANCAPTIPAASADQRPAVPRCIPGAR